MKSYFCPKWYFKYGNTVDSMRSNLHLDLNLVRNRLNYHLKLVLKGSKPQIKDSNHFLQKMKKITI